MMDKFGIILTLKSKYMPIAEVEVFLKHRNISSNIVIGNQCGLNKLIGFDHGGSFYVCSKDNGCSIHRNKLLQFTDFDLVLFSDDDQYFINDYENIIVSEFKNNPKADAIYFKVDVHGDDRPVRIFNKDGKARWKDLSPLGVWGLVIKREVINKYNLSFNENFGPGTDCPMGEDSIYLRELLKHTKNVYLCSKKIADITQEQSTWFKGYDKRFFINIGKVNKYIYPKAFFYHVIKNSIYYFFKFKINPFKVIKWMYEGKRNAK